MPVRTKETEAEFKKNIAGYEKIRAEMESKHMGRVALLSGGKLVAVYNDSGDAYAIGCEKFGLGYFFIKKIGQKPIHIGALTMALINSNKS